MIVYATPLSSIALRVRIALAHKGMAAEFRVPPNGYRSPEYRAIVPASTVPALVDGDLVLSESDAIIEYLEEIRPEPTLLPGSPAMRARSRMLSRLHDFRIEPHLRALLHQLPVATRDEGEVASRFAALHTGFGVVTSMAAPGPFLAGATLGLADCAFPATVIIARRIAPALGTDFAEPAWLADWIAAFRADPPLRALYDGYVEGIDGWVAERLMPA